MVFKNDFFLCGPHMGTCKHGFWKQNISKEIINTSTDNCISNSDFREKSLSPFDYLKNKYFNYKVHWEEIFAEAIKIRFITKVFEKLRAFKNVFIESDSNERN